MDPNTVELISKLAPLGTNALLIVAIVALWNKVNNGYRQEIEALKVSFTKDVEELRRDFKDLQGNVIDILKSSGLDRRKGPRV